MFGLRMKRGLSLLELSSHGLNVQLEDIVDPDALETLMETGFVQLTNDVLCTTERGFPVVDAVLKRLLR